jgi:hypothetical protein
MFNSSLLQNSLPFRAVDFFGQSFALSAKGGIFSISMQPFPLSAPPKQDAAKRRAIKKAAIQGRLGSQGTAAKKLLFNNSRATSSTMDLSKKGCRPSFSVVVQAYKKSIPYAVLCTAGISSNLL